MVADRQSNRDEWESVNLRKEEEPAELDALLDQADKTAEAAEKTSDKPKNKK